MADRTSTERSRDGSPLDRASPLAAAHPAVASSSRTLLASGRLDGDGRAPTLLFWGCCSCRPTRAVCRGSDGRSGSNCNVISCNAVSCAMCHVPYGMWHVTCLKSSVKTQVSKSHVSYLCLILMSCHARCRGSDGRSGSNCNVISCNAVSCAMCHVPYGMWHVTCLKSSVKTQVSKSHVSYLCLILMSRHARCRGSDGRSGARRNAMQRHVM